MYQLVLMYQLIQKPTKRGIRMSNPSIPPTEIKEKIVRVRWWLEINESAYNNILAVAKRKIRKPNQQASHILNKFQPLGGDRNGQ